jgi:hypothetical protein
VNLRDVFTGAGRSRWVTAAAILIAVAAIAPSAISASEQTVVIHFIVHYWWPGVFLRGADTCSSNSFIYRSGDSYSSYRFRAKVGETFGLGDSVMSPSPGRPFRLSRIISEDSVEITVADPMMSLVNQPLWNSARTIAVSHFDVRLETYVPDNAVEYFLRLDTTEVPVFDENPDDDQVGGKVASSEAGDTGVVQFIKELRDPWGRAKEWGEAPDSKGVLQPHGRFTSFYESGAILEQSHYVFGVREGAYCRRYKNGQTEIEGTFYDSLPDGEFRFWNEDGSPAGTALFVDGDGAVILHYANGIQRREIRYLQGVPHGPYREWYADGRLMRQIDLLDTVVDSSGIVDVNRYNERWSPVSGYKWLPVGLGLDYPSHEYNPPKMLKVVLDDKGDSLGLWFDAKALDSQIKWNALLESHGCVGSWPLTALAGYVDTVGYPQLATGRRGHFVSRSQGYRGWTRESHYLNRYGDFYSLEFDSSGKYVNASEQRVTSGVSVSCFYMEISDWMSVIIENFDSCGIHRKSDAIYYFDRCAAKVVSSPSCLIPNFTWVNWDKGGQVRVEHKKDHTVIRCDTISVAAPK